MDIIMRNMIYKYFSYVKLFDGWFEFNDIYISKIHNMNYDSNTAYVLFYKREGI